MPTTRASQAPELFGHFWELLSLEGVDVIVNTTRVTVRSDKQVEFLQTIGRLAELITGAKGCLRFCFYVDAADKNSSLLMSDWETELDLNNHLRSNDFAILRGAITVLSTRCIDFSAQVTTRAWKAET